MKILPGVIADKAARSYLNMYIKNGEAGGLSGLLKKDNRIVSFVENEIICKIPVNKWLFWKNAPMTKGVLLSLIDEIGSIGVAMADKTKRPGVSVMMSATFRPNLESVVQEDEVLTITNRIIKTGKSVSFMEFQASREDGTMLCRGTHTKYLPLPFPWDLMMSPAMLPLTLAFVERFDLSVLYSGASKLGKPTNLKEVFPMVETKEPLPAVTPSGLLCNPLGAIHGGALAAIAIDAVESVPSTELQSINVLFCSAGKPHGKLLQPFVKESEKVTDEQLTSCGGSGLKFMEGVIAQDGKDRPNIVFNASVLVKDL